MIFVQPAIAAPVFFFMLVTCIGAEQPTAVNVRVSSADVDLLNPTDRSGFIVRHKGTDAQRLASEITIGTSKQLFVDDFMISEL